jgi:hypothetical protein
MPIQKNNCYRLVLLTLAALIVAGCGSSENSGADADAGNSTGVAPCPGDLPSGEPCSPEGTSCATTYEHCGTQKSDSGCDCKNGTWQCWESGGEAPADCHECCREAHDQNWYCFTGQCVEASLCEAIGCCIPGDGGDSWCKSNFGNCSTCIAGPSDGGCNPKDCD